MAEHTGSGDPRERISAKRSAGVAALVAAGLAAGALAAGSLASGATADSGDPTTTTSTDPGVTTDRRSGSGHDHDRDDRSDATGRHDAGRPPPVTDPRRRPTRRRRRIRRRRPITPPADSAPPADTTACSHRRRPRSRPRRAQPIRRRRPSRPRRRSSGARPDSGGAAEPPAGDTSTGGGREHRPRTPARAGRDRRPPPPAAPPAPAQPALSARLLPTPAQIRFYVHATSTPPLPKLRTIDHDSRCACPRSPRTRTSTGRCWQPSRASSRASAGPRARSPAGGCRACPPAEADQLRALAAFLHEHGANRNLSAKSTQDALKAYFGSEKKAKRVGALAAFYGALGLGRMQHGLGWHGGQLRKRVLHDKRLHIYPGGRADIRGRRVDPRVLITVEYLANATGSVRVSSLVSGHRLFTASGGVSAHVYGRAVDVTAVGGVRIKHHQGPGSVTERTVRLLLLLPQRMRPRQVVSLMDVDGPTGNRGSFALPDHSDRIQIGY